MKVKVLTNNLQERLPFLNHATSAKNQLPVLLNILLETMNGKLKLSSTDLEIGIETFIPATIEEEGGITIPAKTFTELINSLGEEEITLQTKENLIEVISKKTRSVFQTISKDEFPKLYEKKGEILAVIKAKDLKEDFLSVVFAASNDTSRPALSGVLVRKEKEGFLLVATDGYRLSLRHYKIAEGNKSQIDEKVLIVPARVLREMMATRDDEDTIAIYISEESNQILFEQKDTILVGRLIQAEFPNFEKIIPSDFSAKASFEREELQKAVKICSIFARETANIVKLSFKKDKIVVSSQTPSLGENTVDVDATLNGEENEIAFNAKYLLDLFSNIDERDLVFEMVGPLNAGVFKIKDDDSFLHLIMPIRTQA